MKHIAVERATGESHTACDRELLLKRQPQFVSLHLHSHRETRIEVDEVCFGRADAAKFGDALPDVAETWASVRVGSLNHRHGMV